LWHLSDFLSTVGDPDPEPDPAWSACFWAFRIRILPFSQRRFERTEIMPAKLNFSTKY
jgi:hypothetical protein